MDGSESDNASVISNEPASINYPSLKPVPVPLCKGLSAAADPSPRVMSMAIRTAIPKLPPAKRAIVLTLMASDKILVRTNVITRATYRQLDTSSAGKNGECSVRCLTTSETNDRADIPVAVSTGADPQPDPAPSVIANSDPAIAAPRNTPPGMSSGSSLRDSSRGKTLVAT